jgi:SAM-dependent methyltransferase
MSTKIKKGKCLLCENKRMTKFLDLGSTALANALLAKKSLNQKEAKFPLGLHYCRNCHLVQLGHIVDRKILFEKYNYLSSDSPQLEKYFKEYAENIFERFPQLQGKMVLEIASNDGTLLKYFKNLGYEILGIDPAKNIAKIARSKGIPTLPIFFNSHNAKKISNKNGLAHIITANNVLAHTDDPGDILRGVKEILDPEGIFIFEVQYLGDLINKNEFDNTYHEHTCYFSLHPLYLALKKNGLEIFDIEKVAGQGGSIRVYAMHSMHTPSLAPKVKKFLDSEKKQGLCNLKTYLDFGKKPKKIKKDLSTLLKKLKKNGKVIVGYGASAKGATLLQYSGVDHKLLDYIVDSAKIKQGKYTPGTKIPIYDRDKLKQSRPDYILILAWNYSESIMAQESWLKDGGVKFIIPIPEVKVI